jgi:hypothetical protein
MLAIVAVLGIALVAFVALNLMNQDGGTDGDGIPLPTIVLPTEEPSSYIEPEWSTAWVSTSVAS